ncbi:hypothetical protein AB0K16_60125 [Nonomuraea jabiensis]|uniref:hypothetical protein n=1 Tax=Nonomuraea jabiensis TaxID=882448 RepID=UPI00342D9403
MFFFGTVGLAVAAGEVRGVGVSGEANTTGRSATRGRDVGVEAASIRGETLSVPHALDQIPTATQARKPAMSAGPVRRSRLRRNDRFEKLEASTFAN